MIDNAVNALLSGSYFSVTYWTSHGIGGCALIVKDYHAFSFFFFNKSPPDVTSYSLAVVSLKIWQASVGSY